ncbi:fibronectin type III domain-containing protein [Paenibacillus sp. MMO-58]|uniref:fibronectin type III domain-containing protein n=1 Tax=Paenibacillus sp. MMO-58 TaxID=3081290 RepID=UPI00301A7396
MNNMRHRVFRWISAMLVCTLLAMPVFAGRAYAKVWTEEELGAIQGSQVLIDHLEKPGAMLNPEAAAYGSMESVTVDGQDFTKALRFKTVKQPTSTYLFQYELPIEGAIAKDDVLLATFYARTVSSTVETGEGQMSLVLEKTGTWEKSLTETVAIPVQWKKFIVPIKAAVDMPAGESHVTLRLGYKPQVIEVADLKLINFMKAVTFEELPSTPVTYEGMEDDAPWRAEAEQRIEQYRKGDIGVTVTDEQGSPIEGANVHVAMTNHEFKFGTAVNSSMLMGTDANAETYRAKLKENFNSVVMENEMKWPWWESDKAKAVQAYNWLGQNGFSIRGHNLLWDNASRLPADIPGLLEDKEQLATRIENHIHETAGYFRNRVQDWDVLNEPVLNHLIRDKYGDAFAAEWFKEAKEADPNAKLFVNETQILGVDAPVIESFSNILSSLKEQGAPIDGVGIQAHFGSTPVSPMAFYNQVSHFAQYAPEVAITEFDMNSPREDVQGKFTRDLLIAMFSHPNVTSFTMWGFWDGAHWQNNAPLFRNDWSLKPSGEAWRDLVYGEWWTDVTGATDASGRYKTSGFFGDYEITVTYNGVSQTFSRSFLKNGSREVTVVLGGDKEQPKSFPSLEVPAKSAQLTAPVWPYGSGSSFGASQPSPTSVTLSWPVAKDDKGVQGYRIYRNGKLLTETASNVHKVDVTGLAPGSKYTFEIEAFDKDGNSSLRSSQLLVTTPVGEDHTLPGWKKGSFLTVAELDDSSSALSWPAGVDDGSVTGYRLYVNGQLEGETEKTTYKLQGLLPNTLYVVRVEAKDEEGNLSAGGPVAMFKTTGVSDRQSPVWGSSVLTLSGKASSGLTLAWEPAHDAGGIAAYRIFYGSVELVTLPPSVTSYEVNGLPVEKAHTFRVEAADRAGNWSTAGPSAVVAAEGREDTTAPAWPSDRKLAYSSLTDKAVTLSWTSAEDETGVTGYRIYLNDTEAAAVGGEVRQYTLSSLQPGQSYRIRIEARDAAGHWTSGGPELNVQTSQGVVRTEKQIAPSDDVFIQAPAVLGGDGTNNKDLAYLRYKNAAGVSGSDQNKNTGNNRRVYMKFPLDSIEGSIYSASLNVYVYAVQTPNLDIGMNAYDTGDGWTETTLNWSNKPADGTLLGSTTVRNSGYWKSIPVTDYVIGEANGDKVVSFKLTDDSWLDQNVDMYSKEATGAGAAYRPYLLIGTEAVPGDKNPPVWENGTLEAEVVHPQSARLSWSPAADDVGLNGYRIYQDGNAIADVSADRRTYDVNGLTPGKTYAFKIEALDAVHESIGGPAASIEMPSADVEAPVWPSASAPELSGITRNGAVVSWQSANDQYGVDSYAIYLDDSEVAVVSGSGDTRSYQLEHLQPGKAYSIHITAIDAAGNKGNSQAVILHTAAADTEPPHWAAGSKLNTAAVTDSGAWLNWPAAIDNAAVDSYRIYVGYRLTAIVNGAIRNYFAAGLDEDTNYSFHVEAVDSAGNVSEPLAVENTRTMQQDSIYPQWPTGSRISSEKTDEGIQLQWDSATDNIGVNGYRLYRNGIVIAETDGSARAYTDIANQDTQAVYKIEAADSAGNWSVFGPSTADPAIEIPTDTRPPVWLTGSVITPVHVASTTVGLEWTPAVDQNKVTGYRIYMNGNLVSEAEGTAWTVNNLTPGTVYAFKVEAIDEAGNESVNGPTLQVTTAKPSTGTNPSTGSTADPAKPVITLGSDGAVIISWKNGALPEGGVFKLDSQLLEEALAQAERNQDGERLINIQLPDAAEDKGYGVELPAKFIHAGEATDLIVLRSKRGTLYLPGKMLANNPAVADAQKVTLQIQQAHLSSGIIPYGKIASAIDLSIAIDGKAITYDNPQAPVKVIVPYDVTAAERNNPELLTVWYVDPSGKPTWIRSDRYDQDAKAMLFTVHHFSTYAVANVSRTFEDLGSYEWARKSIEKLAARQIIKGVSEKLYRPELNITRADFLKLLVETLGLQAQSRVSFEDVQTTAYYADAVGIAGSLGIATGMGDGKFHPANAITRQEMFVLVDRALQQTGTKPLSITDADVLGSFEDSSQLAPYAKEAASRLVQTGLMEGNKRLLSPTGYLNRAETAVMMERLLAYVLQ